MDILYAEGELTVNAIQDRLPDPPTTMSIRTFLAILSEKGLVKRRKEGRGFIYRPATQRARAGARNLRKVIQTFFDGSIEKAIGACLADKGAGLTPEEGERLHRLIDEAEQRDRTERRSDR